MSGKRLLWAAIAVVIAIVVMRGRMKERGEASDVVRADMKSLLREAGIYEEHRAFIDRWEELAHQKAFNDAFSLGSRRRGASFDERRYIELYFEELITRAGQFEKKRELAETLRRLSADFLAEYS